MIDDKPAIEGGDCASEILDSDFRAQMEELRAEVKPSILEVLEPASDPKTHGLPLVEGHQVELHEWTAFETYVRCAGKRKQAVAEAAAAAGVAVETIYYWRRLPWWEKLYEQHVMERQQDFHSGLLELTEDAIEASRRILTFDLDEKKSRMATAVAQTVNMMTRLGKKPIQDNRSISTVNAQVLNNSGTINISKERLASMEGEDILRVITGKLRLPE